MQQTSIAIIVVNVIRQHGVQIVAHSHKCGDHKTNGRDFYWRYIFSKQTLVLTTFLSVIVLSKIINSLLIYCLWEYAYYTPRQMSQPLFYVNCNFATQFNIVFKFKLHQHEWTLLYITTVISVKKNWQHDQLYWTNPGNCISHFK